MYHHDYDNSEDSELISSETADIPPHPHERYHPTPNTYHRSNLRTESFIGLIFGILAGVWDAIIKTRNVIVYILIVIVSILLWPVGIFLIVCILCWIFRR